MLFLLQFALIHRVATTVTLRRGLEKIFLVGREFHAKFDCQVIRQQHNKVFGQVFNLSSMKNEVDPVAVGLKNLLLLGTAMPQAAKSANVLLRSVLQPIQKHDAEKDELSAVVDDCLSFES